MQHRASRAACAGAGLVPVLTRLQVEDEVVAVLVHHQQQPHLLQTKLPLDGLQRRQLSMRLPSRSFSRPALGYNCDLKRPASAPPAPP